MRTSVFRVPIFGCQVAVVVSGDLGAATKWAEKWLKIDIDESDCHAWEIGNRERNRYVVGFKPSVCMYGGRSINTIGHEVRHLTDDILLGIESKVRAGSEEAAYLQGYLLERVYAIIHRGE